MDALGHREFNVNSFLNKGQKIAFFNSNNQISP